MTKLSDDILLDAVKLTLLAIACQMIERGVSRNIIAGAMQAAVNEAIASGVKPTGFAVPDGWFVHSIRHEHTKIMYEGDKHFPIPNKPWECGLKRCTGGKLTRGRGNSLHEAMAAAIKNVEKNYGEK